MATPAAEHPVVDSSPTVLKQSEHAAAVILASPTAADFNPSHIPALDGVRGIAILLVIAHHWIQSCCLELPLHGYLASLVFPIAFVGQTGVDLFFVLSGFLITRILLSVKDKPNGIRNFYFRRALRIFPLYYFILFVVLVMVPQPIQHSALRMEAHGSDLNWLWFYGTNIAQSMQMTFRYGALDHFWSLAIEEHFYLFWPFLVLLCNRRALAWCSIALIGVSLFSRWWFIFASGTGGGLAPYVLTCCRLDALACGGLLALAERQRWLSSKLTIPLALAFVAFTVASVGVHRNWFGAAGSVWLSTFEAILFTAMIGLIVVHRNGWLGKLCTNPLLVFFGIYSYGLYAYHHILRPPLIPVTILTSAHKPNDAAFSYGLVHLALSVAVAFLSYHLIEKQFLKLKSRFSNS